MSAALQPGQTLPVLNFLKTGQAPIIMEADQYPAWVFDLDRMDKLDTKKTAQRAAVRAKNLVRLLSLVLFLHADV